MCELLYLDDAILGCTQGKVQVPITIKDLIHLAVRKAGLLAPACFVTVCIGIEYDTFHENDQQSCVILGGRVGERSFEVLVVLESNS